jgi:nitrogen fixation/metabolism regulation signal transduction histidine kinase
MHRNSSQGEPVRSPERKQLIMMIDDLRSRLEESEKKRKHVEDVLINIDEFHLSVLDSLPANIAVLDEYGNIIYVNRSWIRFAHKNGAFSDESIGIGVNYFHICETACGDRSAEAAEALKGMRRVMRGELDHFEIQYPCQSLAKDLWFLMYVTPYLSGERCGIVVTHFDITSRVAAEKAVETAKKQNELYLDLMSHDINNLNQVALGYLELAMAASDPEDAKKLISKSMGSMQSSSLLIDNVRKLQKLKSGSLEDHEVNICHILQLLKEQYANIPGRKTTINFLKLSGCLVIANDLISDVFSNLITNSIKHSDPAKPLAIDINVEAVEENGREYNRITIEDNGPGIPDALKEQMFSGLQRGKAQSEGKGLGLYLVKTLVEGYDGRVSVEDRVQGDHTKGVRFVVILPAA